MTEEKYQDLLMSLNKNPAQGQIIPGTGGVRKMRFATGKDNKGKSGGVRVIYFYEIEKLILLIDVYKKTIKENLTKEECNYLRRNIKQIIKQYKE